MIRPLPFGPENTDAAAYVATLPEEGLAQLEILKSLGCQPHHKVLEIGCGALVAGYPIMQYLDAGNYAGIEPNHWLVMASFKVAEVAAVVAEKRPLFCPRADFRAGAKFDFIISHSILSHASNAQLTDFLVAAAEQLNEGGVLAASIRLAEGNEFGSPGSQKHGAAFTEWQYPGVSWFKKDDAIERARQVRLTASVELGPQQILLGGNPKAVHDWIVVRRTRLALVTAFFRLPDRAVDEDEQFRRFDELAACGLPITLFLDVGFLPYTVKHKNVCVIPLRLGMLPAFQRAQDHDLKLPTHRDPAKDTRDFLLLQNSKIDLLRAACASEHESTHFAWIDFGIMKIVDDKPAFLERLQRLSPPATCVLAPGCLPFHSNSNANDVDWRFCGGFLLIDRYSIAGLVESHHKTFERLGDSLTWEVNVWGQMECAGQRFDWYKADHDDSIIGWKSTVDTERLAGAPRICLNMIVKNEGAIIERCLAAALPFIDTWCIADTGSTDGTPEKIERFFGERNIRGALVRTTFKNFAQARNEALDAARSFPEWDYALLIDADMVLRGSLDKNALDAPAYNIIQHNGTLSYSNTRLVRRDVSAKYFGVTHEYLSVEGTQPLEGLTIDDRNDGGSKSDKGERDIRLLNEGLAVESNNERYMFYLAQTYRETGRHHEAINWYRKRIATGGWDEEIWASYYGIAQSYKAISEEALFIKACLEAYNYRPSRGESLKLLARFYRETGRNEASLLVAETLLGIPYPGDHLFVEHDVYDFGADQEIAIAGYYSKQPRLRAEGYGACAHLTMHPNDSVREEARKNFTFYAKSAAELFSAQLREIDWKPTDGWAPMNPSVCVGEDGRRLVLVRTVNYTIADGQYPTIDGSGIIRTKNYVLEMSSGWATGGCAQIEDVTGLPRSGFPVEGFEDCRLWCSEWSYWMSATVRDLADNHDGRCEMAVVRLDAQWRAVSARPIRDYEHDKTQKNWMPIVGQPGSFLYSCDPTIAIDTTTNSNDNDEPGEDTIYFWRHVPPACLVDLRGGSQLIPHDDGWLCITHEVAWRPERVYLHRFVKFDHEFKIIALSDPFYFNHVGIEFCAGLARDGDRLVASFGVNDASAHLAFFDPDNIDLKIL
jgi:glycosyltransferase involved in cell wall biosynthesis